MSRSASRMALSLLSVFSLVLAMPTAASAACVPVPSELSSWWPANGNAVDVNDSHDGTLVGDTGYTSGKVGQAFVFDGVDDLVRIPHSADLDFGSGDFTIDFWLRFDAPPTYSRPIAKQSGWRIDTTPGMLCMGWTGGSLCTSVLGSPGGLPPVGSWGHFTYRRTGNTLDVFREGVLNNTVQVAGIPDTDGPLTLGCDGFDYSATACGDGGNLVGAIDEFQIYVGRALSDAEIAAIHAAGSEGQCLPAVVCGDDHQQPGEACDDGNLLDGDGCEDDCTLSCGNGVQTGSEECDDGDLVDGDGCDSNCTLTGCGNGIATAGEQCDDGNLVETDSCISTCLSNVCGDGHAWSNHEQCDDGNADETDACNNDCTHNVCGDGHIRAGVEECDDGGFVNGDGCDANCTTTRCGNGVRAPGELCDDGNLADSDGCEGSCTRSPGQLDPSFDGDGIAMVPIVPADDGRRGIAIAPDGSVVIVATIDNGGRDDFAVARYTDAGSPDPGFGIGGVVVTPIATRSNPSAVAVQSDGKVVVAGISKEGSQTSVTLARYIGSGELDASFDGDGIVVTPVGASDSYANAIAIQSDGKILVVGTVESGLLALRYTTTGGLDASFGEAGMVIDPTAPGYGVALQPDGKIVVTAATPDGLVAYRLLADGDFDATFGDHGIAVTTLGAGGEMYPVPALQGDGKILATVFNEGPRSVDFAVARLNADGSVDAPFGGGDGVAAMDVTGDDESSEAVAVLSNGKIVVAGYALNGDYVEIALARFHADGSRDEGFDHNGSLTTGVAINDAATAMALRSDGRIVLVADSTGEVSSEVLILRYMAGGCGDYIAQPDQGETCDDGNLASDDGCENDCSITPVSQDADAGGTVSTDPLGMGASPAFPVQTGITTPGAGTVSIAAVDEPSTPEGLQVVGVQLVIEAPDASVAEPLAIRLVIDPSVIPAGVAPFQLEITRDNGTPILPCSGPPGQASPDPCINSRTVLAGGDVEIVVLTVHASLWGVVARGLNATEQKCVTSINGAGVKVAKAQAKVVAACLKAAGKGAETDPQGCAESDTKGVVGKAGAKTSSTATQKCAPAPAFGFTGAATINDAAAGAVIDLMADVFGADLGDVLLTDEAGVACQQGVAKAVQKLFDAKTKVFLGCKKQRLAATTNVVVSAVGIGRCLESVEAGNYGKVLPKASDKLAATLAGKCAAVDVPAALAGRCSEAEDVASCLSNRTDCQVCRMFAAMDRFDGDCDVFDDGRANDSCP